MSTMSDDTLQTPGTPSAHPGVPGAVPGLVLALASAGSFGLAGPLAKGLLEAGWSVGAAVTARIGLAALVLLPAVAVSLRGRGAVLRRNVWKILAFGTVSVAGVQFAFFSAIEHLAVGVAILVEFTAPVAVVLWLWLRRGHRPGRLTVAGGALAAAGLPLVLGVTGAVDLDVVGLGWALLAMLGVVSYFLLPGDPDDGLPPLVLAGSGLLVGTLALLGLGALGLVPLTFTTAPARLAGAAVPWWLVVLGLGVLTAALAYTTGVAATRRLGSRLASFVALTEVLAAMLWAAALLGELPQGLQAVGGLLVLAGVVVVKLGEPATASEPPAGAGTPR